MANVAVVEPRFARIAASIGDPTRARMLALLLAGDRLPASEIARAVGVSPSTASEHLSKLVDDGLVAVEPRGRHRYFRVSDAEVAHALEALSLVAERRSGDAKWLREPYLPLKFARTCYKHLAGELGVRLLDALVKRRHLVLGEHGYEVTRAGRAWLVEVGVDPSLAVQGGRYAYPCLDWSERRDHLAGPLATTLLEHFMRKRWLVRKVPSRSLAVTPEGRRALLPLL